MTLIYPGTFSKSPELWGLQDANITPIKSACDASVLCADDQWRIDWTSSLGQWTIGQTVEFKEYIKRQVDNGLSATLPFWLEYEVAEKLGGLLSSTIPGWSDENIGVRFGKSGSDVTTAAVRLARAITGRDTIITFSDMYHGWHDWTISRTQPARGVIGWNKGEGMAELGHRVVHVPWGDTLALNGLCGYDPAAVIFEHPPENPPDGWPKYLRDWCDRNGALLISDEVVCWPRYGLGGAAGLYGYQPDLVCIGKGLGNGAAVSALAGPSELMDEFATDSPVFWSSTTNGNPLDLAAANYVLDTWQNSSTVRISEIGGEIMGALEAAGLDVFGRAPRSVLRWESPAKQAYFIKRMAHRGHLINRPNLPNLAMTWVNIDKLGGDAVEVMDEMDVLDWDSMVMIAKPLPRVLFRGR